MPDAEGSTVDVGDVLHYEILLDGVKVGESATPEFTLTAVTAGEHTVSIIAVYASGSSVAGTATFTVTSGIDGIQVTAPDAPAEFYNVAGQRLLTAPTRGIYIEKRGTTAILRTH